MTSELDERLSALRRAFDEGFVAKAREQCEEERDFLVFRCERQLVALPTRELATVERRRKLVPLSGAPRGCRGLAGVRGKLVAVYELAALLGAAETAELRWLVLPRDLPGVALGVPAIERYLRAPLGAVLPRAASADDPCVATLVHEGITHSVLASERLLAGLHAGGAR